MQPIEVTAKKVDDAIREGLRLLGTTLDKVEYKVISSGGLFKKAKISIGLLEDESEKTEKKQYSARDNIDKGFHKQEKATEELKKPQQAQSRGFQQQKSQYAQPKDSQREASHTQSKDSQRESSHMQSKDSQRESSHMQSKDSQQQKPKQSGSSTYHKDKDAAKKPFSDTKQPRESNTEQKAARTIEKKPFRESESRDTETRKRIRTEEISEEDIKNAVEFITELVGLMSIEAEIKAEVINGDLVLDLVSQNGALIGYRGETLDAMEYLVSIRVNKNNDKYISIVVDSCGYRQKREKMLITMAEKAANRCVKTGRKVIMEPMNRSSRKIVHSTLSEYNNITSKSEGMEPNRHIVIFFKRERKA